MPDNALPFLEFAVLALWGCGLLVRWAGNADRARLWALVASGFALLCVSLAWWGLELRSVAELYDEGLLPASLRAHFLVLDRLNAPLMPMVALVFFLALLMTPKTKRNQFSFSRTLILEGLLLALYSCRHDWTLIALLILVAIEPYRDLVAQGKSARVYTLYMGLSCLLLVIGWAGVTLSGSSGGGQMGVPAVPQQQPPLWAVCCVLAAIWIRAGMMPVHSWVPYVFERGTLGSVLLWFTPLTGAWAMVNLLLPIIPDDLLRGLGIMSMVTAVYAAGMASVQRDPRRFLAFLYLGYSAVVMAGLEIATEHGMTGALCVWTALGLALAGLGLVLRSMEARFGQLPLDRYHGLSAHVPQLAAGFALTGLAAIGFPGTMGFISGELLMEGAVTSYPLFGVAMLIAAALNGIAILRVYFLLFTGKRLEASPLLGTLGSERVAILILAVVLLGGGAFSSPWVQSRHRAAEAILADTHRDQDDDDEEDDDDDEDDEEEDEDKEEDDND